MDKKIEIGEGDAWFGYESEDDASLKQSLRASAKPLDSDSDSEVEATTGKSAFTMLSDDDEEDEEDKEIEEVKVASTTVKAVPKSPALPQALRERLEEAERMKQRLAQQREENKRFLTENQEEESVVYASPERPAKRARRDSLGSPSPARLPHTPTNSTKLAVSSDEETDGFALVFRYKDAKFRIEADPNKPLQSIWGRVLANFKLENVPAKQLSLKFDGDKLSLLQTPEQADLTNDDLLELKVLSS